MKRLFHSMSPLFPGTGTSIMATLLALTGLASADAATTLPADRINSPATLQIAGGQSFALRSVRDANDRIVTVGVCLNANSVRQYCVSRLDANMVADPSFGVPPGTNGSGGVIVPVADSGVGRAVAIQKDGKILLGGYCRNDLETDFAFCVARLTENGLIDNSFGINGVVRERVIATGQNFAETMLLQADGKILLAGQCGEGVSADFCFMRLTPQGALDPTFTGPAGTASGAFTVQLRNRLDYLANIAIDPVDGKITGVGACEYAQDKFQRCAVRLTASGAFDLAFNTNVTPGRLLIDVILAGSVERLNAVALQPDGKIVIGGQCQRPGESIRLCLSRYKTNGERDTVDYEFDAGGSYASIYHVTVARDGKILAGGECIFPSSNSDFCVLRLQPDFTLDRSFVSDPSENNPFPGLVRFAGLAGRDLVVGLDIQNDGKIVVTGQCEVNGGMAFCAARLYGGPQSFKHCSRDIDGDGRIDATDAVLTSRVLFGLTGDAVLSGITLSNRATRRTWASIRDHFANQCGVAIVPN